MNANGTLMEEGVYQVVNDTDIVLWVAGPFAAGPDSSGRGTNPNPKLQTPNSKLFPHHLCTFTLPAVNP